MIKKSKNSTFAGSFRMKFISSNTFFKPTKSLSIYTNQTTIAVFHILILVFLLTPCIQAAVKNENIISQIQADTIHINNLVKKAETIIGSKSDSAKFCYEHAIQLLRQPNTENQRITINTKLDSIKYQDEKISHHDERMHAENKKLRSIILNLILLSMIIIAGSSFLLLSFRKKRLNTYQKLLDNISVLKMQNIRNRMSPHFFFNVLSGIIDETEHPESIRKNLGTLSMLLRRSLENIEQTAIPLKEELEVVKGYIELQKWRIPKPFTIEYNIPDMTNLNQLIPAMIIQIPVENAIKHGLIPLSGNKLLRINIENYDGGQRIKVEDNGVGINSSFDRTVGTGTGLKVLLQMINLLNSKNTQKIELSISNKDNSSISGKGTVVEISIPAIYSYII